MGYYGVDLGTTRSAIASVTQFGRAEVIDNSLGERLTPSVVWVSTDGVVVGKHAKEMLGGYPDQVSQLFKRQMGSPKWKFRPNVGEPLSAAELSSKVLESLVGDARARTVDPIDGVVIAVPAYFGHAAREATYRAGELAGLDVIDLINEPTAAILAWMLDTGRRSAGGMLVYDLGGGTFDSVLVRSELDALDVVTIGGNNLLGGHDWDRALTAHFDEVFRAHFGLTDNPTATRETYHLWLDKAEQVKVSLSSSPASQTQVLLQHGAKVLPVTVTREKYDALTSSLRESTLITSGWVLHHAKEKVGLVPEHVLLAGGMSRVPAITELLRSRLNLSPVPMSRPEYMVAEGAALWALKRGAELALDSQDPDVVANHMVSIYGIPRDFAQVLARLKVSHVASRGFAIKYQLRETEQMKLHFLAHAQDSLPISAVWTGATRVDDQSALEVAVYEQRGNRESTDPKHHDLIGSAMMTDIPPGWPSGTQIQVTFAMDHDQVVQVKFTHPGATSPAKAAIYAGLPKY